jgi:hypothetical protein
MGTRELAVRECAALSQVNRERKKKDAALADKA